MNTDQKHCLPGAPTGLALESFPQLPERIAGLLAVAVAAAAIVVIVAAIVVAAGLPPADHAHNPPHLLQPALPGPSTRNCLFQVKSENYFFACEKGPKTKLHDDQSKVY